MKKLLFGFIIGLLSGGVAAWLLLKHGESREPEKEKTGEPKEASRIIHTNDSVLIRLGKKEQEQIGLQLTELREETVRSEIKAYGHVLDPLPLGALVIEISTAQANLETSRKEFERLKGLHELGQNVSTRALESAEAAWKRDQIALESAHLRLTTGWGKKITELPNLGDFVHSLAQIETALVRLDLPLGEAFEKPPMTGRVAPLADEANPVPVEFFGPVFAADQQSQGRGFLFFVNSNALPPGTAVIGWLTVPDEPAKGLVVPRLALVRHEGETFVFREASPDLFERKAIKQRQPLTNGWFIQSELKAGEKIVTKGAQELLSEELKGQMTEE